MESIISWILTMPKGTNILSAYYNITQKNLSTLFKNAEQFPTPHIIIHIPDFSEQSPWQYSSRYS